MIQRVFKELSSETHAAQQDVSEHKLDKKVTIQELTIRKAATYTVTFTLLPPKKYPEQYKKMNALVFKIIVKPGPPHKLKLRGDLLKVFLGKNAVFNMVRACTYICVCVYVRM
jgi:predicted Rossmann fold nucleotide-binding protein DprA/Smf involved in DNA uptake